VRFTVTLTTTLRNVGTESVRSGQIAIPMMATMQGSNQEILSETLTPAPVAVSADDLGNRTGTFDVAGIPAGGVLVIRQDYVIAASGGTGHASSGPVVAAHLEPAIKIESAAAEIAALAAQLTAGLPSVEAQVAKLISYTRDVLRYDAASPASNQGALAGLLAGSGVCEEYASLFVALCRASGIPARVVNGWGRDRNAWQDAWSPDANLRMHRHAWAEVFIPAHGWVTVDPTFNRVGVAGLAAKSLPAGILIADTYGGQSIVGRYSGGRIEVTRDHRLSW